MSDQLLSNQSLSAGSFISSNNGQYRFIYQADGNLVLYRIYADGSSRPLWASNTYGQPGQLCIMQGDGNLVIYDGNSNPLWSTDTWQHQGSRLVMQNDGNLVIYLPDNSPVWASNTVQKDVPNGPRATGDFMRPGEVLNINESITSGNGVYSFIYQSDGNLVLYKKYADNTNGAIWSSNTYGRPGQVCIMQYDGNLVIYDRDANPLWSSETWQYANSRLTVQDDGNVVIYRPDNSPVWATDTEQIYPDGPAASGSDMRPGQALHHDERIISTGGRYILIFQADGNLVLYRDLYGGGTRILWSSNTSGKMGKVCIMQDDGNLVMYDRFGNAVWSTETWNNPSSHLVIQDDGNLVIYRPDNSPVWSTNTYRQTLNFFVSILAAPTGFTVNQMVNEMQKLYEDAGVTVNLVNTITLDLNNEDLAPLNDIEVGNCQMGSPSAEQIALANFRGDAGANDVVIFMCRTVSKTSGALNGCASHPNGRPMAVVSSIATLYTMAHEVGHVLGLEHVANKDQLMFGKDGLGTGALTNLPPDFSQEEVETIIASSLTL